MSKNLCPENDITFDNSKQIKFETPIPAGTYTVSAIVESTDTDSSACLLLFYYADNTTLEVYINRSKAGERVSKTFTFTKEASRVRIYASEGYSLSVGDIGTFSKLQIEAGDQMTEYVPYGEEEPGENLALQEVEIISYYIALAKGFTATSTMQPTCRESVLLRKLVDPTYDISSVKPLTRPSWTELYLWDLINGTTSMKTHIPKSDQEKYLHVAIGGTIDEMPNPNKCLLNFWMNEWIKTLKK